MRAYVIAAFCVRGYWMEATGLNNHLGSHEIRNFPTDHFKGWEVALVTGLLK